MKCDEFDINVAENLRLFNDIKLGGMVYPRGHALTKEDIIVFKMHGIRRIFGAFMEEGDISAAPALGIVAAKLCGEGTAYGVGEDGICRIVAVEDGIFINNEYRDGKFNRLHPHLFLNTVAPYSLIKEGEVIASLELTVPVISQNEIDEVIFKLSGNTELLSVSPLKPLKAGLVYARLQDNAAETRHFTAVVKKLVRDFAALQIDFSNEYNAGYTREQTADAVEDALRAENDVIFVLGALPTACLEDVIPSAMNKIVDEIVCRSIPQVNASDLIIARKRGKTVIALPYNYDSAETSLINRCIKLALFSEKPTAADFEHRQLPEQKAGVVLDAEQRSGFIASQGHGRRKKKASIGAIVLAAGIGSRTGRNKLMVEVEEGVPLFMKAVNAAIGSDASPVFVITGYHDDEMQEYLENVDVNVIYNPAYRSGVRTSIELGLKSVPSFCDGAMIIPADMPNLTAEDLNKLIAVFDPKAEKQLCMFTAKGVKSNPVIWSSSLFDKADIVPENANVRPVFMEHADYTSTVELKGKNKLLDVNYPSDLEQVALKQKDEA